MHVLEEKRDQGISDGRSRQRVVLSVVGVAFQALRAWWIMCSMMSWRSIRPWTAA